MEQAQTQSEEHLTLGQAARLVPGRPSANCVWRWCREGVRSKAGGRVRLRHTRFGGRIFTTRTWIEAFGAALAEADAAHFDRRDEEESLADPAASPRRRGPFESDARREHLEAERELEAEGL